MSVRKRGDRYLVTAELGRDEFGVRRRVCKSFTDSDAADRYDAKLRHEIYEGTHVRPSHESVASFCRRYVEQQTRIVPTTRARKLSIIECHIAPDLGRVTLERFTPQVAARWMQQQLARGLSPATVHKHLTLVGAALELAVAWGLVRENAMRKVQLPPPGEASFHVYTTAEQAALIAAAQSCEGEEQGYHVGRVEGTMHLPVVLALATGMRRGELLGLRVGDLDGQGRLHIEQTRRKGKKGDEKGRGKTARSRRVVLLPSSVAALVARYRAERAPCRSDRLLLSARLEPWTIDGFASAWRRVRVRAAQRLVSDAAELGDPYAAHAGDALLAARFHDLRHTHATELLRAGVHVKVVAERLGDAETTVLRTYSHVLPDMQEAAVAALEPIMAGLIHGGLEST